MRPRLSSSANVSVLTLLALTMCVACDDDDFNGIDTPRPSAQESFSFDVPVFERTAVRLRGINGTVEIVGDTAASSISITGTRKVESDSVEDARANLPRLQVRVTEPGTEVLVETVQPENSEGRNYNVDYVISLQPYFEVDVVNVNGAVQVSSLTSVVSVLAVNGVVTANALEGNSTVSVVNGEIDGMVTLPQNGTIGWNLTNGNIELSIPTDTSARLSASVVNGGITVSNLELSGRVQTPVSLTGTLGAGEGSITLGLVNGNIIVRGR